ncbi:polysaccharide pyruvyl transferase family protein [Azospirillum brasilense]|uniref:polysaccharide pyruvyl transferase family protein n=1 Tax=Azospirillum brasilense TaxID=192 RepID=UPI000E67EB50|nr:polysaccharide pyruvyl transferase family protein [Azospirillum brasilense]NUB26886.1 pyruvyl transferase epsO [Azospirillum brasilense]NUB34654.1 pyruvyl transferase epsO [Azospirillum brasilense]RIV98022.1 pyruvyl transferase epsO [Azospirillum brasilense]
MDTWCYDGGAGGRAAAGSGDGGAAGGAAAGAADLWLDPDLAALEALSLRVRDLVLPHLGSGPAVYADIPVHLNVGDLLINQGAETLFADGGVEIRERVTLGNARRLLRRQRDGQAAILLHGGGNFGDLYPHHETFRQKVLESFPSSRIVLLPQTVYYRDHDQLRHDMKRWSAHRNLVFMARDAPSLDLVRPFLGERAIQVPDLAHYLTRYPTRLTPVRPAHDTTLLVMARRDQECAGRHWLRQDSPVFDWEDLCGPEDFAGFALAARLIRLDDAFPLPADPLRGWYPIRDRLVRKAVAHFGAANAVVTNRLHGMLLALMMGLPVQVRDNSYGKLTNYIDSWLADWKR